MAIKKALQQEAEALLKEEGWGRPVLGADSILKT